uniref:Uncharacterized protein n=1 Tax=Alexandrium catenella TaxID=2925 RepID=A0A7S1Q972_ALECA
MPVACCDGREPRPNADGHDRLAAQPPGVGGVFPHGARSLFAQAAHHCHLAEQRSHSNCHGGACGLLGGGLAAGRDAINSEPRTGEVSGHSSLPSTEGCNNHDCGMLSYLLGITKV